MFHDCTEFKRDRQCTYNVTLRHVRVTDVAVGKQSLVHISVCVRARALAPRVVFVFPIFLPITHVLMKTEHVAGLGEGRAMINHLTGVLDVSTSTLFISFIT